MARFRETLWFKTGAEQAQDSVTSTQALTTEARSLPIEDRYNDDSSLTMVDRVAFSVRTGLTCPMPFTPTTPTIANRRELVSLVGELKRGRVRWLAIVGVMIAVAIVVAVCTR
jgi:hypothetical protein